MEKKVKLDSTQKIQLAGAAILLLCVFPLPYGFFTIVRVVTTIISCYLAYTYFTQDKKELAIAFAVIAVLFQPFILDIPGFVRMLRKPATTASSVWSTNAT